MYTIRHKEKVLDLFVEWKKQIEKHTGKRSRYYVRIMVMSTLVIFSYSYAMTIALRDTSQLEKHYNRMGQPKG